MALYVNDPFFTLNVGKGGTYRWKDKKAFGDELSKRGLADSQVDKVWRLYTDRDLILRYSAPGFGYQIGRERFAALAHELGIHGRKKGVTASHLLERLVVRADCFITWWEGEAGADDDDNELLQFASPMYHDGVLTEMGKINRELP